jgi:hypothetical protein
MGEVIVRMERKPGIELLHLTGAPGYQTEHLILSNSGSNGLRFEIMDDGDDVDSPGSDGWWCFHIKSPETARLIAAKLLEWSDRIANPPPAS